MKMTQCQVGRIGLLEDDIIMVDIDAGTEIGIEHITEFRNVATDLVKFRKNLYTIVSYGAFSIPTATAREHCGMEERNNNHILGRAIIVHGLGQMIIAKHTIKQRKSIVPTRIFTDKNTAKKWVKDLRAKNDDYQMLNNKRG